MHSGNRHLKIINFTLNATFDQFLFVANETAKFTLFYNCLVCMLFQVLFCVQKVKIQAYWRFYRVPSFNHWCLGFISEFIRTMDDQLR